MNSKEFLILNFRDNFLIKMRSQFCEKNFDSKFESIVSESSSLLLYNDLISAIPDQTFGLTYEVKNLKVLVFLDNSFVENNESDTFLLMINCIEKTLSEVLLNSEDIIIRDKYLNLEIFPSSVEHFLKDEEVCFLLYNLEYRAKHSVFAIIFSSEEFKDVHNTVKVA